MPWCATNATIHHINTNANTNTNTNTMQGLESEEQQALAPTHVVDILRCSFTVDTISRNLDLGGTIAKHFTALRAKNMHQLDNDGYADRKYNILFPAKVTDADDVSFVNF